MVNEVIERASVGFSFDSVVSSCRSATNHLSMSCFCTLLKSESFLGTCQVLKRLPQIASRREKIVIAVTGLAVAALLKTYDIAGWTGSVLLGGLSGIIFNKAVNADWRQSPFAQMMLAGDDQRAQKLLETMDPSALSQTDYWIQRTYLRHHTFSTAEFLSLPAHLKKKIHQIANVYMDRELLQKLRGCGLSFPHKVGTDEKYPFSPFMDFMDVEECAIRFLRDLKKQGQLMTPEEYKLSGFTDSYRYRCEDAITRIIGRNFIQRRIDRLAGVYRNGGMHLT